MIETNTLREKVLDLAIRGKLVSQNPNDEPASVLLERIRTEKQQMVKDGKFKAKDIKNDTIIFKGEDNLHYEKFQDGTVKCIEDEIPFDVPEGWAWARMFSLTQDLPYGTSKKSLSSGEIAVLRMGNLQQGEIDYSDLVYSSDKEDIDKYLLTYGDLLFNRTNSSEWVGKTAIYRGEIPAIYAGYLIRIRSFLDAEYLNSVMNSKYAKEICLFVKTDAVNQSNINATKLGRFLIPVPPFSEQIRISNIVSEALYWSNFIESNKLEIKQSIQQIKSKVLDLAIRGKLVPQDSNDEPASVLLEHICAEKEELIKQGKIKCDKKEAIIFKGDDNSYYEKIGDNVVDISAEVPFEIPENWSFVRLEDVLKYEQPTPYIVKSTDYKDEYQTPVLTAGKSFIIGYTNETAGIKTELPVIIFDDFTTDSKYVDFPFKVKSSAMKILTAVEKLLNIKFAFYAMQVVRCDNYNHKRYWISEFSKKLIPLPPKTEQSKIVEAIEELYKYIEQSLI